MRKTTFLIVAVMAALAACGSPRPATLTPEPNKGTIKKIPTWYIGTPTDDNYLLAPATAVSRDLQLAVDKAQHEGRNQIAAQLETRYSSLGKRFVEEVGTDSDSELLDQFSSASKAVVSQALNGTRSREKEIVSEQGMYRAYVLMEMPIGKANKLLMDKIRSNQHMYTRFRSSQTFQDLEGETDPEAAAAPTGQ